MTSGSGSTRIVFLGGVGEIGRNMTVFESEGRLLVLDCGFMFPTEEMLGVDLVLPDFQYLRDRKDQIEAVLLTHGHEDHIGSLPYLLREFDLDIYGTQLTLGLLKPKLEEHRVIDKARLLEIAESQEIDIGPFHVRTFPVVHSIPGGIGSVIRTKDGTILHTGDFKIDRETSGKLTPATDLALLAELGRSGVDLMLSDSTNAERPGSTPSERIVAKAISEVVAGAEGRVIVACFASNLQRIQEVVSAAEQASRLVCFLGRSLLTNVAVTRELGFMDIPESMVVPVEDIDRFPRDKVVVISTGSQGEPLSALSLMASRAHKWVELDSTDTVVVSATPIPGNESAVRRVMDGLYRIGAKVVNPPDTPVHVSGHGSADDLALALELVKPRWFIPVHGEYRHLATHAEIAQRSGVPKERTLVVEDGDVVELRKGELTRAERVHAGYILVDGLGIGDVGEVVLRDRRVLADDGICVCVVTIDSQTGELLAGPDIITRGFVYEDEAAEFLERAKAEIRESLALLAQDEVTDWSEIRRAVRKALGSFVWQNTRRRPMILPVVTEV